ncbi:MAG: peptidylprolyl isomerase [Muribaculum sp.]|nr:peptidylprolyl isomerase [Muribaculum sp.]
MNKTLIAALAIAAGSIFDCAAKEEIIMTVNGQGVTRSEFEYLYNKNRQQQVDPQTIDEYAEMFKIYKLKVADALDQRLDTLPSFVQEMAQYKTDLAAPYMTDSLFINSLVKEAYDRSREEVEAFHIMLPHGRSTFETKQNRLKADSIRNVILSGGDYAELAKEFSVDRGSSQQGGRMGFITEGRFPYAFEVAAFSLQPGEISDVVDSGQGFHILKGGKHRPARGSVLVEHIMRLLKPDASPQEEAAVKTTVDSIYNVVKADPSKFEELATKLSEDPGSARQGGKLNWFSAGMMVEPFDSASFAIAVDEISAPVKSQFGWHIIKKLDAKAPASIEEMKPSLLKRMSSPQDPRTLLIRKNLISKLAKKHKGALNDKNIATLCDLVLKQDVDSAWLEGAKDPGRLGSTEIARIGKKPLLLADFADYNKSLNMPAGEDAADQLKQLIEAYYGKCLIETEQDWLYANEPDYSNLLNEYREGSLLYEASLRAVWDKAAKDTDGLNNYFASHRDDYKWQKPHVKGILVQAANDSVADLVRAKLASLKDDTDIKAVRKEFAGKAALDRILMEEGQNPMVDNVIFGKDPVKPNNKKYTVYFVWEPKMLNAPEVMEDVKGLVTGDYQNQLESDWVESLKAKYPVTVNAKVLKKVK